MFILSLTSGRIYIGALPVIGREPERGEVRATKKGKTTKIYTIRTKHKQTDVTVVRDV